MNPLGLLFLALGVVIIVVGVKGSQHNLVAAFTNRAQAGQTSGGKTTSLASFNTAAPTSSSKTQLV